jgi:hypothetical protein
MRPVRSGRRGPSSAAALSRLRSLAARAQHSALPVIRFLYPSSPETYRLRALRQGLKDAGFVEGENVAITSIDRP